MNYSVTLHPVSKAIKSKHLWSENGIHLHMETCKWNYNL